MEGNPSERTELIGWPWDRAHLTLQRLTGGLVDVEIGRECGSEGGKWDIQSVQPSSVVVHDAITDSIQFSSIYML